MTKSKMFPASIFEPQWLGGNHRDLLSENCFVLYFALRLLYFFLYFILKGNILLTNDLTYDRFIVNCDILLLVN